MSDENPFEAMMKAGQEWAKSIKTKLLLTLQGLTIQGAVAEAQIKLTVRHVIEAGATSQEVAETIALAGMFGGVPAMTKAMELANAVMKKDDKT